MTRAPASLTAALIRRSARGTNVGTMADEAAASLAPRSVPNLRFFLLAWAAGFVAFLTFLA